MYLLRRERALEVTGNQGVEPAMEWFVLLTNFLLQVVFDRSRRKLLWNNFIVFEGY